MKRPCQTDSQRTISTITSRAATLRAGYLSTPGLNKFLPYSRQDITEADINAVADVLRSDWLTQGPGIRRFEEKLAEYVSAEEAIACSNGTAALHLAMLALGIREGDAILTTPISFLADANCARYVGADVRFADIDANTGLIDVASVKRELQNDASKRIKAIIPVHFAGQAADLAEIQTMAQQHGASVVDDACHAIGASYIYGGREYRLGGSPHSDMTVFSFHPVKHVAMGEGGAITTNNPELAKRLRLFRNHGVQRDGFRLGEMAISEEGTVNPWYYEQSDLGYNYRLTDIQAALGTSQLERLDDSLAKRRRLADCYREKLREIPCSHLVNHLKVIESRFHAYHLFIVRIDFERAGISRASVMDRLRRMGIGTQVHYIPIHLQPYYRFLSGLSEGSLPASEEYYEQALSLPMYPGLNECDIERVVRALSEVLDSVPSRPKVSFLRKG